MDPDQIERLTRRLRADIIAAWASIQKQQLDLAHEWWHLKTPARAARLRDFEHNIRQILNRVDDIAGQHVLGAIEGAYELGAWTTALRAGTGSVMLNVIDFDTVTVFAEETMSDLLAATQHVRQQTKATVQRLARENIRTKLYTGMTAEQAGIALATDLRATGVTGVTYRNGRNFPLDAYTEMVVRTKTAEAYQTGGFNQGERLDIEFWEVFDGWDCGWTSHDDADKANGKIVRLDQAREYPIAHPNCLRSTSPRPDIKSWTQIEGAQRSTTASQREVQKQAELAREAARKQRPRHVALMNRSVATQARRDRIIRARHGIMSPAELRHKQLIEASRHAG